MKNTLEGLWNNYFLNECAVINTFDERELTKKAVELHEKANALLNAEQQKAVEKYVDSLCEINSIFVKKAFFKGCEFGVSFLQETMNLEK